MPANRAHLSDTLKIRVSFLEFQGMQTTTVHAPLPLGEQVQVVSLAEAFDLF